MNDPRERPPLDELDDALRRAVEEVRADPQPEEAFLRALERARKIHTPANGRLRFLNQRLLAVSGIAATLMVGGVYWMLRPAVVTRQSVDVIAMAQRDPSKLGREAERLTNEGDGQLGDRATRSEQAIAEEMAEALRRMERNAVNMPSSTGRSVGVGRGGSAGVQIDAAGAGGAALPKPVYTNKPGSGEYKPLEFQHLQQTTPLRDAASDPAPSGTTTKDGRPAAKLGESRINLNTVTQEDVIQRGAPAPGQTLLSPARRSDSEAPGGMPAQAATPAPVAAPTPPRSPVTAEALPELGIRTLDASPANNLQDLTREVELKQKQYADIQRLNRQNRGPMATEQLKLANEELQQLSERLDKARKGQAPAEEDLKREVSLGEKKEALYKNLLDQKAISPDAYRGAKDSLERAKKSLKEVQEAKQPQVWRRDRQRPTFARVYVGNGNSLELVSLNVSVTVEGPRARTVVDHVFHNPHNRALEGTFEYPLPSGATASYFAMFSGQARDAAPERFARRANLQPLPADALARLTPAEMAKQVSAADWGTLQEARVVGKAKALETYEDIVRGNIDPALLEYSGGNTFSGRVFPIQPRGYNRVLIAYEELLPFANTGVQYRFPLPDCKLAELQFSLSADAAECRDPSLAIASPLTPDPSPARGEGRKKGHGSVSYTRLWKDQGPGGDAVFAFMPPKPDVQVISGRQGESGPLYFYTRLRPDLPVETAKPFAEHAVFLLDTSLSEHPDRFDVNMKLLRKILESDPALKQFNILTFDVASRWVEPKSWLENTAAGRAKALNRLDGVVLEGATDIVAALDRLADVALPERTPLDVFLLSDGQITWGETEVATLVARYENRCRQQVRFHCYRTGIGADNLELFDALTRRGGGIFNCFSDADINAAAVAHRHHCFQLQRVTLTGGPEASDLLVAGRKAAIYPGGELIVAARANQTGRQQFVLEGTFLGKSHTLKYTLDIDGAGELAPRGWGEVAVASLLALNDPKLDELVTAYCQQFGIGSRVASFLVLENPNDYKRLNLESERGRTVPGGDLGRFLDEAWMKLGAVESPKKAFEHFLGKIASRVPLMNGPNGAHVRQLLAALDDKDFALAGKAASGEIVSEKDVPPQYLAARNADRRNVETYLQEARRRNNARDVYGAVRVLSSVIEEYPGRADALRLVGYRLLALNQAVPAAQLFRQVLNARPFEPHSYRDFARSLEDCGKFGAAALQYEIVLAGNWHNRFRDSLKGVSQEEYINMMRQALQQRAVTGKLADLFGERLEQLASVKTQSDLRVTISWNTDATDVDLWVIEPDGTKCFYQHNRTKNGGELSQDQTQGYGPERYQIARTLPGTYTVLVHYYRANQNLLGGETHVNVVVTRHAGTPEENSQRYNVILKKANEVVEVYKLR